jgi:hypothetical protein
MMKNRSMDGAERRGVGARSSQAKAHSDSGASGKLAGRAGEGRVVSVEDGMG